MFCMKCGREIRESGVFCNNCLAEMEKYPVKPNISIQLPSRPDNSAPKKKTKPVKEIPPEEQIRHLKSRSRWLGFAFTVSLIAFLLSSVLILWILDPKGGGFEFSTESSGVTTSSTTENT